jgi:uncharacterized repeat protein (TIGR03803 family)
MQKINEYLVILVSRYRAARLTISLPRRSSFAEILRESDRAQFALIGQEFRADHNQHSVRHGLSQIPNDRAQARKTAHDRPNVHVICMFCELNCNNSALFHESHKLVAFFQRLVCIIRSRDEKWRGTFRAALSHETNLKENHIMRGKTAVVVAVALILATGAFAGTAASKGTHKPSVSFSTLYNFSDGSSDGGFVFGAPVIDKSGNIWGTAESGGADGYGTVWKLSKGGSISVVHSFADTDGAYPYVGLTQQPGKGNVFGTTYYGGSNGYGTVFEVNSGGTFSTLYNFGASGDPEYIFSDVVLDTNGNLYGTGEEGGADGYGGIWKVSSGTESVLYSFTDGSDGGFPFLGNMHRDAAGDLFGVSEEGGSGCGTLFEYSAGGTFSVLHAFNCGSDGGYATGNILEYKGSLYGTAQEYGDNDYGTVWQYAISTGTFTVLHAFDYTDGGFPLGGVACQQGKKTVCAGNLFGTTVEGGTDGYGTVWEINSSGTFTSLHSFAETDGAYPYSRPYVNKAGNVYGTTYYGGSSSYGTVYEITGAK